MGVFEKKRTESEWQETGKKGHAFRWLQEKPWVFRGAAVSLVLAIVLTCFYGIFRTRAEKFEASPLESAENIEWLYQSCYLLYRDLYNVQHEEQLDYSDLYLKVYEEYGWILDEDRWETYDKFFERMEEYKSFERMEEYEGAEYSGPADFKLGVPDEWVEEYLESGTVDGISREEYEDIKVALADLQFYFQMLEESFRSLNSNYDYIIEDSVTGKYITNMSPDDRNRPLSSEYFLISFAFDSAGNVTIEDNVCGIDENRIRKLAQEALRTKSLASVIGDTYIYERDIVGKVFNPLNCTVTFAVSKDDWNKRGGSFSVGASNAYYHNSVFLYYNTAPFYYDYSVDAYYDAGLNTVVGLCIFAMFLMAFFLPMRGTKPWREEKICAVPLEFLAVFIIVLTAFTDSILSLVAYVASGHAGGAFLTYLPVEPAAAEFIVRTLNVLVLTVFFFACWYGGVCARAVRDYGMKEYIKRRSLIYRFFPFMKGQAVKAYVSVSHMDLLADSNKTIIKLLLVNGVILFLISCMWIGGFAVTLVYSVVLYLVLRKFVSDLQKRYAVLLKAVDEIAEGNLNVTISEDLGVFEPFREQIFKIQDGLQKAVDTEVRSQRMKAELVTNMSHDLKTPLTAIITYVNLLKDGNITEEQRREYLATLERKSNRLKSLIEDLFEFSRVNSNNITLNIMDVDIMNLVKQVCFEMSDKIDAAGLDVRMNLTEEKVVLPLDSQKTYRIYENLFGNIAKYAMPGTRFYVNGFRIDDRVVITLKNISMQEITVDPAELTERFVRGDTSRNTEGSGLGLAIAKSFTELQGGQLTLEVDGDLFKVTTTWAYCSHDEKKDIQRI